MHDERASLEPLAAGGRDPVQLAVTGLSEGRPLATATADERTSTPRIWAVVALLTLDSGALAVPGELLDRRQDDDGRSP